MITGTALLIVTTWVVFALVAWTVGISAADRVRWGTTLLGLAGRIRAAGEARG